MSAVEMLSSAAPATSIPTGEELVQRARALAPKLRERALTAERISTSIHFLPVHRLSWYRERYPAQPSLPVAERAGDEIEALGSVAPPTRSQPSIQTAPALGRTAVRVAQ